MMTQTQARQKYEELRADPAVVDRVIGWLGGRVTVELKYIIGRSLSYYSALAVIEKEVDRRYWAFILAAAELRERLPRNSQFMRQREEERAEKKGRSPFAGWTTARRIESDYEIAAAMLDDGRTYAQAAAELARRSPTKYYHHKPSPDNLRKVMRRLGYGHKKKPTDQGGLSSD